MKTKAPLGALGFLIPLEKISQAVRGHDGSAITADKNNLVPRKGRLKKIPAIIVITV